MGWLVLALAASFGLGAILGAPYLPTRRREAEKALDLLDLKAGQTLVDLGSGDGAVLLAAARRGVKAVGYEINPLLWLVSVIRTFGFRRLVSVKLGSMWRPDLDGADAVFIFGIRRFMPKFDQRLQRLKKPTKVASYVFELPREEVRRDGAVFLYFYP